jgi:4-hydroxy-4-methyl-2-oxoglutarate aldolase
MGPTAFRSIPRPSAELVERFRETYVASIHEVMGVRGLLDPAIRPLVSGLRAVGPAVTALSASGDNLAMHVALSTTQPGDVLVVSCQAASLAAQWGGLATHAAVAYGVAGVVVDGAARDVAVARAEGLPVWARHIAAWGSSKRSVPGVNVPITCGGINVVPGDLIVADDDGVVVVPRANAEAVLIAALERDARERSIVDRIHGGERLFEILGFDRVIAELGVELVDADDPTRST